MDLIENKRRQPEARAGNNGKISICQRLDRSFRKMQRVKRLRVSEVNPHLICVLCGGYYIDATTIIECLHTFCKTCIVGYLEASKHCPVCDNLVHKTKPHLRLRPDHTLQDLVYKLVPGLFQDEMKKRREFYKEEIDTGRVGENGIPEERERIIYSADEHISLVIELSSDGNAPFSTSGRSSRQPRLEAADRRYLSCPGNFTVGHLKKFIKMKFNLCDRFQIDLFHTDESLYDHYTLVDIAYIYSWRRKGPLRLYYTVYTNQAKRFKADIEETVPMETDVANNSDLKTETSGYISDEEKVVSENEKSLSQESDESKHDSVLEGDGIDIEHNTVTIGDIKINEKPSRSKDSDVPTKIPESKNESVKDVPDTSEVTKVVDKVKKDADETIKPDKNAMDKMNSKDSITPKDTDATLKGTDILPALTNKQKNVDTNIEKQDEVEVVKDSEKKMIDVNDSDKIDANNKKGVEENDKCLTVEKKKSTEASNKPEMVEVSTCTNGISATKAKCNMQVSKQSKSIITDDDISEPVVSSTQNTQGCQTDAPCSSSSDTLDVAHSSEVDCTRSTVSPSCRSTADASCETDNFIMSRRMSVDSVSVSTETDMKKNENLTNSRKLVDCSTDVYDFPNSESKEKVSVDCSTDFEGFPADSTKTNALTVDCSTSIDSPTPLSNKRKSMDYDTYSDSNKSLKKSDSKLYKRSFSYAGHLTSPKAGYLAQPLSPTKMKITSPKSPVRTPPTTPAPKSPSRAEPSGFQTQYQSFVKTEITYRLEGHDADITTPSSVKPSIVHKPESSSINTFSQSLASNSKKSHGKTGRPRGRPPKNRSFEPLQPPKEKKHKSRSHSPKHRKSSDKDKDRTSSVGGGIDKLKISKAFIGDQSKSPTAYTWINKIDNGQKLPSDKKVQKSTKSSSGEKTPSDLRIPKQFLYFSNGQYTIATVSSLSTLKQSSPVSPPPKTVYTSDVSAKTKPKPVTSDTKKQTFTETVSEKKQTEIKIQEKCDQKLTKPADAVKGQFMPEKSERCSQKVDLNEAISCHKTDSNQNKILKAPVENDSTQVKRVKTPSVNMTLPKETNKEARKEVVKEKPAVSVPEYRHQSPFFASISNAAKLQAPHRPTTHLNVPNLSSHFSGTHHLYSQNRFANERLGTPIYRSFSMNDKSPTASIASKYEEARRFEALASASQCGYLGPFPGPYLGLMHSHLVSSLPPPPPLSKLGHYPENSRSLSFSETSTNCANTLSQNTAKPLTKTTNSSSKGKEKSIDRIISAITEMRAKKETQEQLNGIDLSTKNNRNVEKPKETERSEAKVDRFEFTDDDEGPYSKKKQVCNKETPTGKSSV